MYEQWEFLYSLEDFGVLPPDPDDEILEFEPAALPADFEETVKGADKALWDRMYSLETLLKVKFVPRAADNSIDRSENDFIIVSALLKLGFSPEVCCSVLLHPKWECGSKGREKGYEYAARTVAAAIKRRSKIIDADIHAFGPDGKFSPNLAAHSIVEKYYVTWFRGAQWSFQDGYYQLGSQTAEYLSLEGSLVYSLLPSHLLNTRKLISEIAQINPGTLEDSANWIAVKNGLVNLRDGNLMPASPRYFTPGRIPIEYCPKIADTTYQKLRGYIRSVVGEENEPLIWYQLGMCLTTDSRVIRIPVAIILHGPRSTGKSELLRLISDFLGPENVSAIDIVSLASDKDYYTWNLMGKRANITHEAPPEINLLNTARVKTLISGDETELREIAKAPVPANNYARFWLAMNHEIRSKVDPALYKRLRIIKTSHDFSRDPNERPGYSRQLAEDPQILSAMFNLSLKALWELRSLGAFPETESTKAAMNEQRESNDSVEEFIVECTEDAPDYVETTTEFYSAYEQYCNQSRKGNPMGKKKFKKHLEDIMLDRLDIKLTFDPGKWIPEKHNTYPAWIGRKILWHTFSVNSSSGKVEIKLVKAKEA